MYPAAKYEKYLADAFDLANRHSKDPSTKVAAIILGTRFEPLSSGWNGAARGCTADEDHRYENRAEKLWWAVHAEANAIANAAAVGARLVGGTMVVTHFPCMTCANLIVQAGIVRVIVPHPTPEFLERWAEHVGRSQALFAECSVEVEYVEINHGNS